MGVNGLVDFIHKKGIDCIEEHGGRLYGYEFKWGGEEIRKATRREFSETYPESSLQTINPENFEDFLAW